VTFFKDSLFYPERRKSASGNPGFSKIPGENGKRRRKDGDERRKDRKKTWTFSGK
jgi:hypothetical protein